MKLCRGESGPERGVSHSPGSQPGLQEAWQRFQGGQIHIRAAGGGVMEEHNEDPRY